MFICLIDKCYWSNWKQSKKFPKSFHYPINIPFLEKVNLGDLNITVCTNDHCNAYSELWYPHFLTHLTVMRSSKIICMGSKDGERFSRKSQKWNKFHHQMRFSNLNLPETFFISNKTSNNGNQMIKVIPYKIKICFRLYRRDGSSYHLSNIILYCM